MRIFLSIMVVLIIVNLSFGQTQNNKSIDKSIIAQLDTIHKEDQRYRLQIIEITKKSQRSESDNLELVALIETMHQKDSINLLKVTKILNEYGWLGEDVIGEEGNKTLFLVIQHADLETQLKYLPMMQNAAKNGNLKSKELALLEDRIAMRQGKRQTYGSQIVKDYNTGESYVYPLVEPEKVNERREKVGLEPIEDYVKQAVGMTWDVEKHKERTRIIESQREE